MYEDGTFEAIGLTINHGNMTDAEVTLAIECYEVPRGPVSQID